jgi:hypothetical protein
MSLRVSLASFLVLIAVNTSCSGPDGNGQEDAAGLPQSEAEMAARAAAEEAVDVPTISARTYVGGSAKVNVTGSFQIDTAIPINTQASISDGEMTWLQYGNSGSEVPEALVTISTFEIGVMVAHGKPTATIGAVDCTGGMEVKEVLITGHYKCPNVTSYDPRSGQMGTVNIEIDFTAAS